MKDILSEREKRNADLALKAAREGIVLLENNGVLPIKKDKIALFGAGARHTAKGGTGSGEVNNRHTSASKRGLRSAARRSPRRAGSTTATIGLRKKRRDGTNRSERSESRIPSSVSGIS